MHERVGRCFLLLTLFMLLSVLTANVISVTNLDWISHQSSTVVSELEKQGMLLASTSHDSITIDGDANFADKALVEEWFGDGSPENPFIIDRLDIDLGGEVGCCISISNTRVSFIISNCSLSGAREGDWNEGAGIYLENVTNSKLVSNTCHKNKHGIYFSDSDSNTVAINRCSRNDHGIYFSDSDSNTVNYNTCNSNNYGICLYESYFNTMANNTCNQYFHNYQGGIWSYQGVGIFLNESDSNTVANNTCNNNRIGIYLNNSDWNMVVNNNILNNTEHDIYFYNSHSNTLANNITQLNPAALQFIGFVIGLVGITLLGKGRLKIYAEGGQDDIIIPIRYRISSWFRKRRSIRHVDADETLEPDSSER